MSLPHGRARPKAQPSTPQNPTKHFHKLSAAGSQRQPKRHKNANLTMPNQKPHDILGVPEDATASQVRKAYLRLALKKHPDKGGDVDEFRVLQEAYEALRDGGGSEEAKESSPAASPAASPRAPPPPKAKSKRFRCATCGKRFSSHLALRAHSVEHPKAKDDEDRRAAARARGAAPKVDEDEPPKPRRRRPERSNGGFEAFDRRRSAEARARGGARRRARRRRRVGITRRWSAAGVLLFCRGDGVQLVLHTGRAAPGAGRHPRADQH